MVKIAKLLNMEDTVHTLFLFLVGGNTRKKKKVEGSSRYLCIPRHWGENLFRPLRK